MEINAINKTNGYLINKPSAQKDTQKNENSINSTSCALAYPKNYYLSFQGANFNELYKRYEDSMPQTVKDHIDTVRYLSSESEFEAAKQKGFITFHMEAFEDLRNCKTIDDIKATFPNEKAFQNLKTPKELSKNEAGIFGHMRDLEQRGIKVLNTQEDVTTFIVKKIFLECKEYKEVFTALQNSLSKEAKENGLDETFSNYKRKSDSSIYRALGIIPPNGREYAVSIRYSNGDYGKNRRKYFANLSAQETNEKIAKLLSEEDKKARYSMMDAWNNCPEIRESLSSFLTNSANNPAFYIDNTLGSEDLSIYDSRFYTRMSRIMTAFWNKNPEYKEKLGEEIAKAITRYNQISVQGEDALNDHIRNIEKKSKEIRANIQLKKLENRAQFPKAIELITLAASKTNIFDSKNQSAISDFTQLLLGKILQEEFKILEGSPKSEEFKKFIPMGLKLRMKDAINTSEFTNISNAHHVALLNTLENIDMPKEEKEALIENAKTSLKAATKKLLESEYAGNIDFAKTETDYIRYKSPLAQSEVEAVKYELLTSNPDFELLDIDNFDNLLATQGKYLKFILTDNALKDLTHILFWSEYDRVYGTNYTQAITKNQDLDKIFTKAIEYIDSIELDNTLMCW